MKKPGIDHLILRNPRRKITPRSRTRETFNSGGTVEGDGIAYSKYFLGGCEFSQWSNSAPRNKSRHFRALIAFVQTDTTQDACPTSLGLQGELTAFTGGNVPPTQVADRNFDNR